MKRFFCPLSVRYLVLSLVLCWMIGCGASIQLEEAKAFCKNFQDIFSNPTGTCQFTIACLEEKNTGCTEEDLKRHKLFFDCLRQSDLCADKMLPFLKICAEKAGKDSKSTNPSCTYKVSISNSTPQLEAVFGTVGCDQHSIKGTKASVMARFMLQDRGKALQLHKITNSNLDGSHFSIKSVKVVNESGEEVSDVKATVTLDPASMKIRLHPHAEQVRKNLSQDQAPRAIRLLIDTSQYAADVDAGRTRTSSAAGWVLEFPREPAKDEQHDLVGATLFRGESSKDNIDLFSQVSDPYTSPEKKTCGYIPMTETNGVNASEEFVRVSPLVSEKHAPLYDALEHAIRTTCVSRSKQKLTYNPLILALSLTPDISVKAPNAPGSLKVTLDKVKQQIKASGENVFTPVSFIVYPREPSMSSTSEWDTHVKDLCALANTSKDADGNVWGQVFLIPPTQGRRYQSSVRAALDAATAGMEGQVELGMKVELQGAKPGTRYYVGVTVDVTLYGKKTSESQPIWWMMTP